MPIPKGKCQKCKDRHICGIGDLVHPDDIAIVKEKYGIKFEIRVTECHDYARETK